LHRDDYARNSLPYDEFGLRGSHNLRNMQETRSGRVRNPSHVRQLEMVIHRLKLVCRELDEKEKLDQRKSGRRHSEIDTRVLHVG
jgi:hypothetical protein